MPVPMLSPALTPISLARPRRGGREETVSAMAGVTLVLALALMALVLWLVVYR
jgi:hypothetical protein